MAIHLDTSGPLGSEGIQFESLGVGSYRATLAAARGFPAVPNALQFRVRGAAGIPLEIEARFEYPDPRGKLDEYFHSASLDFESFLPLHWSEPINGRVNRLIIPATGWNEFHVGMQFPFPAEALETRLARWGRHPHADVDTLGTSIEGRPIRRITITDPSSPAPRTSRWHHYLVNQHPGEGNARWRISGMIDWLLSDEPAAIDLRQRAIVTAVPLLCPDGPANGWRRVNADGIDMNRCFRPEGPDQRNQTHEAWLFQSELEALHQGPTPVDTLWCMHTWPGIVEPIMDGLGPEFGRQVGNFEALAASFREHTSPSRLKPLRNRETPGLPVTWNGGPRRRYGITTALIEGGGNPPQLDEHPAAGAELMHVIASFWHGLRTG